MKNNRLSSASLWINEFDSLADIGCDHGYLGILALKKGVKRILLVDNKKGPLSTSQENLQPFKEDGIEIKFLLSDGLTEVDDSYNVISILGMGGLLIEKILDNANFDLTGKKIILDAHTKLDSLRKYLFENGYKILDEQIVFENNIYYELIFCEKTKEKILYNYEDIFFGSVLRIKKSPLFIQKWTKRLEYLKNMRNSMNKNIEKINDEISLIERELCLE